MTNNSMNPFLRGRYTMTRVRTGHVRKGRLQNEWSIENARLGGITAREHPLCLLLQHNLLHAPYLLPSRQWAAWRSWAKARVRLLSEL